MHLRVKVISPLIFLSCLALSGCGSNENPESEPKPKASATTGQCSNEELAGGSAWISGQLKAFSNSDAKSAYSFASKQFRSAVSLEVFAEIISSQYGALQNLASFEIINCSIIEDGFVFQLNLVDKQSESFSMKYLLSFIDNQWGVDAATIAQEVNPPTL